MFPLPFDDSDSNFEILTVSEFTSQFKFTVENQFADLWISGEISNFKEHSASGHCYFSLKDDGAVLRAVLFKYSKANIRFQPENGLKVKAHGKISVYDKRGDYQIIIDYMEPEGMGALQLAFIQLQEKLNKEGLFDPEHKKEIPGFPEKVGVITSATGAAVKDILNVSERRYPGKDIYIYPAIVQGEDAAEDIAYKIQLANKMNIVDVLIVGRGGGSIEDLWAFNEEAVVRAIYESEIPIISAVGHEVDYTISDFVADLRAPTPSAAAELALPHQESLMEEVARYFERMDYSIHSKLDRYKEKMTHFSEESLFRKLEQKLTQSKLNLDLLMQNLINSMDKKVEHKKTQLSLLYEKLFSLGPSTILKRGYSLTYKVEEGKEELIKSVSQVNIEDQLEVYLSDGVLEVEVKSIRDDRE